LVRQYGQTKLGAPLGLLRAVYEVPVGDHSHRVVRGDLLHEMLPALPQKLLSGVEHHRAVVTGYKVWGQHPVNTSNMSVRNYDYGLRHDFFPPCGHWPQRSV
jgi:hypothetical protein